MKKIYIALFALLAVGSTFTACTEEEPFATVTENDDSDNKIEFTENGEYTLVLTQEILNKIQTKDRFLCVGHGYHVDLVTVK